MCIMVLSQVMQDSCDKLARRCGSRRTAAIAIVRPACSFQRTWILWVGFILTLKWPLNDGESKATSP